MAEYANQHFLQKSYLKEFSNNGSKKHLGIYVIPSKLFIASGSIKEQCRKLNYYGADGALEKELGRLETQFGILTKQLIKTVKIPDISSQSYIYLLKMILLTELRNPAVIKLHQASNKELNRLAKQKFQNPYLDDSNIDLVSMHVSFTNWLTPFIMDLGCALVINSTPTPFLTSDNPVIAYNQFAESKGIKYAVTGVSSIGLQYIFPISPTLMLVLYDKNTYTFHGKNNVVTHIDPTEVKALNVLQLLNCSETIYFNEKISKLKIESLYEAHLFYDKAGKVIGRTLYNTHSDGSTDITSGFFSAPSSFAASDLKLHFFSLTESAKTVILTGNLNVRETSISGMLDLPDQMQQYGNFIMQNIPKTTE